MKIKASLKKKVKSSQSTFEDKIRKIDESHNFLKILLYGRNGTGKTSFIGTAPKPLLVLDVKENGTNSIRKSKESFIVNIETWPDIEEAYWYLKDNPGKYKTVAIDCLTPLQDLAVAQVTGGKNTTMTQRGWGEASSLLKVWLVLFRDLPMNVIFTAYDRVFNVDENEQVESLIAPEVGPYLMPSAAKIVNGAVDVIGNTFIREVEKKVMVKGKAEKRTSIEYCLRVGPHSRYVTKIRRDQSLEEKLPESVIDPTFDKILKLSLGGE